MKVLQREPMRVADFEEYSRQLPGIPASRNVEIEGARGVDGALDDIDPSLDVPRLSVNVAATGPRTIAVAARRATASFSVGADARSPSAASNRNAGRDAGRDPRRRRAGHTLQVAVTDADDVTAARRSAVPSSRTRASVFEVRPVSVVGAGRHGEYRHAVEDDGGVRASAEGDAADELAERRGARLLSARPAGRVDRPPPPPARPNTAPNGYEEIADLGLKRIYIGTRGVGVDLEERNAHGSVASLLPLPAAWIRRNLIMNWIRSGNRMRSDMGR